MPRSCSSSRRAFLLRRVAHRGVLMAFKCAGCRKAQRECVKSSDSKSCLECLRRGYSCDMEPFARSDFAKLDRERDRLDREEAQARERMRDAMAKLDRLDKQRRFLADREAKLVALGLDNVEELERLEAEEEATRQSSADATAEASNVVSGDDLFGLESPSAIDEFLRQDPQWFAGFETVGGSGDKSQS